MRIAISRVVARFPRRLMFDHFVAGCRSDTVECDEQCPRVPAIDADPVSASRSGPENDRRHSEIARGSLCRCRNCSQVNKAPFRDLCASHGFR